MNPAFMYYNEITFNNDNKFILDFSNEKFVQKIKFFKRKDYFITSLNCNLKLKAITKEDKKKKKLKNYQK